MIIPLLALLCMNIQFTTALPIDDVLEDELQCDAANPNIIPTDPVGVPSSLTQRAVQNCHVTSTTFTEPAQPWVKEDSRYRVVVNRYTSQRISKENMEQFWSRWKQELHVDFCIARQSDPSITAQSDVEGRKIDYRNQSLGSQLKLTPVKDIYSFSYKEMVSVRRRLELWTSEFTANEGVPGAKLLVADVKTNEVVASGWLLLNPREGTC